jgi:hypothetical protein
LSVEDLALLRNTLKEEIYALRVRAEVTLPVKRIRLDPSRER